jgi:ubiquinone/menaquinone biosynthesis C-methylase UbiE
LHHIQKNFGLECFGIDPSVRSVHLANELGVQASKGTADWLDYSRDKFDFVVFGFCLYLCDRDDLFQIAKEADRVLKPYGWLLIHDFFSPSPVARDYSHYAGVKSFKMDYRKLFEWHPNYTCISHHISSHCDSAFTDDRNEWIAISVIRKKSENE